MPSINILNNTIRPDDSGEVYEDDVHNVCVFSTNTDIQGGCVAFEYPSAVDIGIRGSFVVPADYVGTPKIIIRGVNDGNVNTLAFGFQIVPAVVDNESADQAYDVADLANVALSGYADNDELKLEITLTPAAAFSPGDTVAFWLFRDYSVDTVAAGNGFAMRSAHFNYADS